MNVYRKKFVIAWACSVLAGIGVANGDISIRAQPGTGVPFIFGTVPCGSGFFLEQGANWSNVWISESAGMINCDLGSVTAAGESGSDKVYRVGNLFSTGNFFCVPPGWIGVRHWGGMTDVWDRINLMAHITGDLVGGISVKSIWILAVDGIVDAPVTSTGSFFCVNAGWINSGGDLRAMTTTMRVSSINYILGDITADNANIQDITAGTFLGAPGLEIVITAKSGIGSIVAADVYADINPDSDGDGVGTIGSFNVSGVYSGDLSLPSFDSFSLGSDFVGTITLTNSLPNGRILTIGGDMFGDVIIQGDLDGKIDVTGAILGNIQIAGMISSNGAIDPPSILAAW